MIISIKESRMPRHQYILQFITTHLIQHTTTTFYHLSPVENSHNTSSTPFTSSSSLYTNPAYPAHSPTTFVDLTPIHPSP